MSFGATVNGLVFQPVNFLSSWEGHVPWHPKLLRSEAGFGVYRQKNYLWVSLRQDSNENGLVELCF